VAEEDHNREIGAVANLKKV